MITLLIFSSDKSLRNKSSFFLFQKRGEAAGKRVCLSHGKNYSCLGNPGWFNTAAWHLSERLGEVCWGHIFLLHWAKVSAVWKSTHKKCTVKRAAKWSCCWPRLIQYKFFLSVKTQEWITEEFWSQKIEDNTLYTVCYIHVSFPEVDTFFKS